MRLPWIFAGSGFIFFATFLAFSLASGAKYI
jgi:hypothetical protein